MKDSDFPILINSLKSGRAYPHDVGSIEVIETHISWVLLTGEFAYKIKKPVNFGFVDFGDEDKREKCCRLEVELNRRMAPQIYLGTICITGSPQNPVVHIGTEPDGEKLTHAVRMRQFPKGRLLNDLAKIGGVDISVAEDLATRIAVFHKRTEVAGRETIYGTPSAVKAPILANFEHLEKARSVADQFPELEKLRSWCSEFLEVNERTLADRKASGYIRDCHGDLHLNNILLLDGETVAFDCLEFNPGLRIIDVMSEVAFLLMDLIDHGLSAEGYHFLNSYLTLTGDYQGVQLLPLYLTYRSMVRAKVAAIQVSQHPDNGDSAQDLIRIALEYLKLAESFTSEKSPRIIITHGVSGSGKSTIAAKYAADSGAIHIRSDVERKRLFGISPEESTPEEMKKDVYSPESTKRVYELLCQYGQSITSAGFTVILDATFLRKYQRDQIRKLAAEIDIPFQIMHCAISREEARDRVRQRQAAGGDPSEAGVDVLEAQLASMEPLTDEERNFVLPL